MEAAVRWINESKHKRSLDSDIDHLRWLDPYLKNTPLTKIDRTRIEEIANIKAATGVTDARVNRLLALIRAILNKAVNQWDWLDNAPKVILRKENNHRTRWLTQKAAQILLNNLPPHYAKMALFTLATGLRKSNVLKLKWEDIELVKRHAWIHADQAKGNKAIAIPLNDDAMQILRQCKGEHPSYVFTYRKKPIQNICNKVWKKALSRAGIDNFRWHDLRHTWASWHVQNGTNLQELQLLGGWSSFSMVLRYAHLSSEHLQEAASRIHVTNSLQCTLKAHDRNKKEENNLLI